MTTLTGPGPIYACMGSISLSNANINSSDTDKLKGPMLLLGSFHLRMCPWRMLLYMAAKSKQACMGTRAAINIADHRPYA